MELLNKPDAERVLSRYEDWWLCQNDTPLAQVQIGQPFDFPSRKHATVEDSWYDFEYRIDWFEAACRNTCFLADSFPAFNPNLGPDLLSTLWGTKMEYAPDTSWASPIVSGCAEVLKIQADFETYYWQEAVRFTRMALDAGQGKWWTGTHDLHQNADVPSALIGPQALCLEFADDLDLVRRAIEHVTPPSVEAFLRLHELTSATGQPTFSWLPVPHMGRGYVAQCDFSALISRPMFEEAVMPSIREELRATDRTIFHLDGPSALQHLDVLLREPDIHGIQWVYGAGNGPARRWREVYQRIQHAGKCMQVVAEEPEDVIELSKVLKPQGVLYTFGFGTTMTEAEALLQVLGTPVAKTSRC